MIKIRKIRKEEYQTLLDVMNKSFSFVGEDVFECILPRVYYKDNKNMIHFGVFVDDKLVSSIGIYKETFINEHNISITSGIVGAVSTLPEYRNNGYFSLLMKHVMSYIKRKKIYDITMLSGKYERYNRFGYEYGGCNIRINIPKTNISTSLFMEKVNKDDISSLSAILDIYNSNKQHACRNINNIYQYLITWKSVPYVFKDKDKIIGYACIKDNEIYELGYINNYLLPIMEVLSTVDNYLLILPGYTNIDQIKNKYEYKYGNNHLFIILNYQNVAKYLYFEDGYEKLLSKIPKNKKVEACLGNATPHSKFGKLCLSISQLDFA